MEYVAAWENDTTVERIGSTERKRVYTALRQSHLDRMADAGIIEYDVDIEEANVEEVSFRGGSSSGNGGENSGSGGGTIYVTIDGPADSLDADVWNDELEHASTSLEDGANPVKEIEIDQPVVAVRFPELDQLFVRDEDAFEPNECEFEDIQGSQTVEATDSGAFLECVEED